MKRNILIYALLLGGMVTLLKFLEFRFMVKSISTEIYIGSIALFFTLLGLWVGLRIISSRRKTIVIDGTEFTLNTDAVEEHGISKRELEVLELMAQGLSNQEIGDKLFVSTNTVKTHVSNVLSKLDARRRTQAIQRAKELSIIR